MVIYLAQIVFLKSISSKKNQVCSFFPQMYQYFEVPPSLFVEFHINDSKITKLNYLKVIGTNAHYERD
jgi:hypothetical protein